MEIVCHIGATIGDWDRLHRSLLRDADALAARDVVVPGPARYRKLLTEAIRARVAGTPIEADRDALVEGAVGGGDAQRVILANSTFLGLPPAVFWRGSFFPRAESKAAAMAEIFEGDRLEMHLPLRNLATFLPSAYTQAADRSLQTWLSGADPRDACWSDVVAALRRGAPEALLTVWCNEDSPLIWGEILDRLGGPGSTEPPQGRHDLVMDIMSPEGAERFARYLEQHPDQAPAQERRVIGAYLSKYALPEETWEEVDLPGWDAALVHDLTALYDEDVARVAAMDGVTFLQP